MCLRVDSASTERVGEREVGGVTRRVAARLGGERVMVGWATSCPDCIDRLTKHYSHFVGS